MGKAGEVKPDIGGVTFGGTAQDLCATRTRFYALLERHDLANHVSTLQLASQTAIRFLLHDTLAQAWMPDGDTTQLCRLRGLDPRHKPDDLEQEILLAMLANRSVEVEFPSFDEFESALRIRANIVNHAYKTRLAFDTEEAERPADDWIYAEATGFTLRPGKLLAASLIKATQPDVSGKLFSFSCYRATEYVILLAIAQELALSNPELAAQLQRQWETRAVMSGEFHDVFLREHGSLDEPLPPKYFIPGDRLWFRNPDDNSSNVPGYEGSWVLYLGNGLFSNFWNASRLFTLTTKCIELFHWRDGARMSPDGKPYIDEAAVNERVEHSTGDAAEVQRILALMLRFRDPQGVYEQGGCLDASREWPRWVRPSTSDIVLPGK